MPLVSIITINYNNTIGLSKTINSVIHQTYQEFEYIVIDGGSTDESINVISQFNRINKYVSEKDNGIYDAMNKGIAKATGDYLLFLNSGDVLVDHHVLQKTTAYLHSNLSFYYGNVMIEKDTITQKHIAPSTINIDFMLNSTFWHPCIFIKSSLFKLHGLYNVQFKIGGDYEFFIRCLLKPNISTQHINEVITLFDGNGISNDQKLQLEQKKERELAWSINTSVIVYDALKNYTNFSRSKFANIINFVQKMRGKERY